MQPTDIVILSNGPGEVTTWVRPVVRALARLGRSRWRISVLLSPCPHSTGKESAIASSYPEVDRVLSAANFWQFLLWGKTPENWQWHPQGIVLFLGGDQFYTVAISQRLGYKSVIYAEWDARWYRWVDRFAAMNQTVVDKVSPAYQHKFSVVGNLMSDAASEIALNPTSESEQPLIGLLVGSKPAKLAQGVPLCLAIAEEIQQQQPLVRFVIPVAPTLSLSDLQNYASCQTNPIISSQGWTGGKIVEDDNAPSLISDRGTKIELLTQFPAYQTLANCQLCLTTVGANTAELTALGVPMVVLLPTQQLDAMRSWDGLPGIMANLPGVGTVFAKSINWLILKQGRLFAWPNIWAKQEIVPRTSRQARARNSCSDSFRLFSTAAKTRGNADQFSCCGRKVGCSKTDCRYNRARNT